MMRDTFGIILILSLVAMVQCKPPRPMKPSPPPPVQTDAPTSAVNRASEESVNEGSLKITMQLQHGIILFSLH